MITNTDKIEEALTRSVAEILPNKEGLKKLMQKGRQLRIYIGIDPTATYVHLGHATNYLLLKRFHRLGHKITVLIGDFTATIGDPSDKTAVRKRLEREEIVENMKTFKDQIGKILDFNDKQNPIEFKYNSEWLSKMKFDDIVEIASHFTVQQMIERDVFERRIKENKPLYVHEFLYPLMQGYDSLALEPDVEVGGTDQTFNMLVGRTLLKKLRDKEKFVITTTLLENPKTGEKLMSKNAGTGVALSADPTDMYGKVMAFPDGAVRQCFVDCTEISLGDINKIMSLGNPRDSKMRLALEIVTLYHGPHVAQRAQETFTKTFGGGEKPENIEEFRLTKNIQDTVVSGGVVSSNSEWRRLVSAGAVKNMDTGKKIVDPNETVSKDTTIKIGKHRFVKIIVE